MLIDFFSFFLLWIASCTTYSDNVWEKLILIGNKNSIPVGCIPPTHLTVFCARLWTQHFLALEGRGACVAGGYAWHTPCGQNDWQVWKYNFRKLRLRAVKIIAFINKHFMWNNFLSVSLSTVTLVFVTVIFKWTMRFEHLTDGLFCKNYNNATDGGIHRQK